MSDAIESLSGSARQKWGIKGKHISAAGKITGIVWILTATILKGAKLLDLTVDDILKVGMVIAMVPAGVDLNLLAEKIWNKPAGGGPARVMGQSPEGK